MIALAITAMIFDHRQQLRPVHSALSVVAAPLQYLANWPTQMISTVRSDLTSHHQLLQENAKLRSQQLILQTQLQQMLALEQENRELRALLNAAPRTHSDRVLAAGLLDITTGNFVHEMVLDKGTKDGVFVNQPVLSDQGIVGQVIETGPLTSRVMLITDSRSAIPVQDSRNGIRGLVVGTGNPDRLSLANMVHTNDLQVNDVLMTSGLGGRYPAGYPVGIISNITHQSGNAFATIEVQPSAKMNSIQQVMLIWPNPTLAAPASTAATNNSKQPDDRKPHHSKDRL